MEQDLDRGPHLTPAQRGRIGAYVAVARYGPDRIAARARRGLLEKYADQADPEHKLSEAERRVRGRALLRAHMARISNLGVEARRKKRARREAQLRARRDTDAAEAGTAASQGVTEGGDGTQAST